MAWSPYPVAGSKARASDIENLISELRPNAARKTANEIVNGSSTPQADDELFVPVAASTYYVVDGLLVFTSGTTPDFRYTLSGPSGMTYSLNAKVFSRSLAAPSVMVDTRTSTSGNLGADGLGTTLSSQGQIIELTGWVLTSVTPGTVTVLWSQNTSNGSDTTLYGPGSYFELTRKTAS